MATVTNDIVTRFAFEGNISPISEFNSQMGGGIKFMAVFATALAGTGVAIAKWATDISQGQDAVGQLARTTKVSVETLGEMSFMAEQSGSSVNAMQSSISSLSQKIGEASISGSEDFSRMGISVRDSAGQLKTADQVFFEFSNRVKELNLSQQQTQDFASRLGIDESLVQLLSKSSSEINLLRKRAIELGRTTTEQSDAMLAYNDSVKTLGNAYEGLKVKVAVGLIPQLRKLSEGMTTWLVESSEAIIKVFKNVVNFTLIMMESFKRMAPVMLLVAGGFIAMKIAALGFSGVLRVLGKLPIIALLIGLYLVIDDIITAFRGGESVIADFYEKMSGGRSLVEDLTTVWKGFVDTIKIVGGVFLSIGKWVVGAVEDMGLFYKILTGGRSIVEDLMSVFDTFLDGLAQIWDILSKIGGAVARLGSGAFNLVMRMFSDDKTDKVEPEARNSSEKPDDRTDKEKIAFINGLVKPDQSMLGSSTTNTRNASITNQNSFEIRTPDPVRAGEEVAKQLDRQTEDAYLQSGVAPR